MSNPSQSCIDLIKRSEGLSVKPYRDLAGFWTVGYGHKLTDAELSAQPLSLAVIDEMLQADTDTACAQVHKLVTVPLSQGKLDALTDFVFNLGAGRLAGSTLLKLLNTGNYAAAGQELLKWDMAGGRVQPGLIARRKAELAMWVTA